MLAKGQNTSGLICDFSQLPKDQCAHCSGVSPRLKPHYQLKSGWFEGCPVVEILKDGGPVHPHDEHFRFGGQKAWLLLGALEVIKEFAANTDDEGNTTVTSQIVREESGVQLEIWVEMHEEFVRSTGELIKRPWLQIHRLPEGPRIGIGVQKAKAVSYLAKELRKWVEAS
jgi:hypothetical protein